jgi:O-acetyl-ADP-ribose deacetylase (regulator of RNase III)
MVERVRGNLLEAEAEALVNTVNCVGVMGRGIALQFKLAYPDNFKAYLRACKAEEVQPGHMLVTAIEQLVNPRFIINFPTKRHWKGKSRIEDIEAGLPALVREIKRLGVRSVAVPPLGCGNGGLDWDQVRPRIEAAFDEIPDVHVFLFEPEGAPAATSMPVGTPRPKMTRARALLLSLIDLYRIPGYRLTKLEVQKLAYFLQAAGEPLKLSYRKDQYGPYAENLNHVLQHIEGHFIRGYGDRSSRAQISLLPAGAEEAKAFLANSAEAQERLDRVAALIKGYESPYSMELLATVHWVASEGAKPAKDPSAAITLVHDWNKRKRALFEPEHIRTAWKRLDDQKLLPDSTMS